MIEFISLEWVGTKRKSAVVLLDRERDEEGILELKREPVLIDGRPYKVTGVELFMHMPPWRAGERVALCVVPYIPPEQGT